MRITSVEPFVCTGGLREFGFLKVTTDSGIVGWAETYDWHTSASLWSALRVMGRSLIGEDPRRIELMNERVWYGGRPGVPERQKVLAALDMALWDIKAKALDVPVHVLLGGKLRDRLKLYWTHFATYQALWPDVIDATPTTTYLEWAERAHTVVAQGYDMLKTNLMQEPREPGGPTRLAPYADGAMLSETIDEAVKWIGTIRDVVGPDIGISVDVQFDYRMGAIVQLARALEPFDLYWLEVESFDAQALRAASEQTTTRLCHGESLIRREQFRPFLQERSTDVVMLETLANGVSETRRIAEMAELYDITVSPHNWMSPLGTLINAQLCSVLPNFEILEIDIDDVPWKNELLTHPIEIEDGELIVSDRPGWGADIDKDVVAAHALPAERLP